MARTIYGIGINDCNYPITQAVDGKIVRCIYYNTWHSMMGRCYSEKSLILRPTYKGCSVVEEWHIFSNFKIWMESQDWKGKNLDKDILFKGNKIYGPETCVFVSNHVNLIFTNNHSRTIYPKGVSPGTRKGTYIAQCGANAKDKYLGTYNSIEAARQAYMSRKAEILYSLADKQSDDRIKKALIDFALELN